MEKYLLSARARPTAQPGCACRTWGISVGPLGEVCCWERSGLLPTGLTPEALAQDPRRLAGAACVGKQL